MSHEVYQKVSVCAQQAEAPLSALPEALPDALPRVDTGADSAQHDQALGGSSHEYLSQWERHTGITNHPAFNNIQRYH